MVVASSCIRSIGLQRLSSSETPFPFCPSARDLRIVLNLTLTFSYIYIYHAKSDLLSISQLSSILHPQKSLSLHAIILLLVHVVNLHSGGLRESCSIRWLLLLHRCWTSLYSQCCCYSDLTSSALFNSVYGSKPFPLCATVSFAGLDLQPTCIIRSFWTLVSSLFYLQGLLAIFRSRSYGCSAYSLCFGSIQELSLPL